MFRLILFNLHQVFHNRRNSSTHLECLLSHVIRIRLEKSGKISLKDRRCKRNETRQNHASKNSDNEISGQHCRCNHGRVDQHKVRHMKSKRGHCDRDNHRRLHSVSDCKDNSKCKGNRIRKCQNHDSVHEIYCKKHFPAHRKAVIKVHLTARIQVRKTAESADKSGYCHHENHHAVLKRQPGLDLISIPQKSLLIDRIILNLPCKKGHGYRIQEKESDSDQGKRPDSTSQIFFHQLKK